MCSIDTLLTWMDEIEVRSTADKSAGSSRKFLPDLKRPCQSAGAAFTVYKKCDGRETVAPRCHTFDALRCFRAALSCSAGT